MQLHVSLDAVVRRLWSFKLEAMAGSGWQRAQALPVADLQVGSELILWCIHNSPLSGEADRGTFWPQSAWLLKSL